MADILYGLPVLGFVVGVFGTLVGAGGGFLLIPVLLAAYPGETTERITAISMCVIFFNGISGTYAYARMKRINFRAGSWFAAASIPGAFLGAAATKALSRDSFHSLVGGMLMFIALLLMARAFIERRLKDHGAGSDGQDIRLSRSILVRGSMISSVVGFLASLLGIGGGVLHVPALIYLAGFPAHVATATSHFVLCVTSAVAVFTHFMIESPAAIWQRVALLAVGVVFGAQLGARLSTRVHRSVIVGGLGTAMFLVGLRLVLT